MTVRRQPGATGQGVGDAAPAVRALLRSDDCEQRHQRDDCHAGDGHRPGAHHPAVGARVLAVLTRQRTGMPRLPRGLRLRVGRLHAGLQRGALLRQIHETKMQIHATSPQHTIKVLPRHKSNSNWRKQQNSIHYGRWWWQWGLEDWSTGR